MHIPKGRLTDILAVATVVIWLLAELSGYQDYAAYFAGFIPARLEGGLELEGALPVWITPLSAVFVHANLAHVGFNMLMLFFCGRFVEHVIGAMPYGVLYVAGAFVSALAQFAVEPGSQVPMVGASGAVSAVVGAYALFYGKQRTRAIGPASARIVQIAWLAAAWVAIQALFGLAMSDAGMPIAVAAHIGGFIAGLLLARPLMLWRYRSA